MPGPQRLTGNGVKLFRNAVLLPALDNLQRPAVGRENGAAQRLILPVEQKQSFTLSGDTDAFNLLAGDACTLQEPGNGGCTLLPELVHVAFGVTRQWRCRL